MTIFLRLQNIKCFCVKQVRDYIHVMDLADGHIAALRKLFTKEDIGDHSSLHMYLYVNEFSVTC